MAVVSTTIFQKLEQNLAAAYDKLTAVQGDLQTPDSIAYLVSTAKNWVRGGSDQGYGVMPLDASATYSLGIPAPVSIASLGYAMYVPPLKYRYKGFQGDFAGASVNPALNPYGAQNYTRGIDGWKEMYTTVAAGQATGVHISVVVGLANIVPTYSPTKGVYLAGATLAFAKSHMVVGTTAYTPSYISIPLDESIASIHPPTLTPTLS